MQSPQQALARYVTEHRTQSAAARSLGISAPYLHDLLNGRRGFSDRLLAALGFERIIRPLRRKVEA